MLVLSDQVRCTLEGEGLSEAALLDMVTKSAIISHERGNRRFHSWLFQVEGDTVTSMTGMEHKQYIRKGSQSMLVFEECPACLGAGCRPCRWIGEVAIHYTNN